MRKAKPKKRVILPDPVFNDVKVSKFVNHLMYDGKKNTAAPAPELFGLCLEALVPALFAPRPAVPAPCPAVPLWAEA